MMSPRGRAVVAVAAGWIGLGMATGARGQSSDRASSARFQRPRAERTVEAQGPPEESRAGRASSRATGPAPSSLPGNMEESIYLRERPDALGEASREFRSRLLARLLSERERWVHVRRTSAIRLLEEFVDEEPDTAPEMADALLRLSELIWEDARNHYLKAFAAWQKVPRANRGPEPRPDYARAMTLYDRILTGHRDFERYDFVLYMKAYALIELSRLPEALQLYRKILEEHPNSRFVPDAHMALAESHFTGSYDYAAALAEYNKVLRYPSSGLYDVALFKSAWCMWRLGRNQEAATRFRKVLDLEQRRGQLTAQQRRRLRELQEEALEYLIQVFVEDESNTAKDVFAFLEDIGGDRYANRVLSKLSETYYGQSRFARGIEAYELLLERQPYHPRAPWWQQQIAEGRVMMGQEEDAIPDLRKLAFGFGPATEWARNQVDRELVARAGRLGERTIRRQALRWHEEGQREDQKKRLTTVERLYGLYLERYRRARAAYQIYFYRGEILFHRLDRFAEAGDAYLSAAKRNPRGSLTRDALYNAIGAFERVRETELQTCNESTKCGESDNDRKFAEAIELYVQLFPNDPDLPEILFRQGKLYFDRGVYDPAVRLWGQLLDRYPDSPFAESAGELILDSFNRAKDYRNIERWARRLKASPAFAANDKQRRLNGLILQAVFKIGEQLAARGKHEEAADAYLRAAEEFPRDARARQAYYNAGQERQRAGDLAGAASAYDQLIELHPGSSEGALACWAAAQAYEAIAQFSDAATYYEAYAKDFPKGEKAKDAAYNAVLLRVTANDYQAAVRDGERYLERYPRSEDSDAVVFFIGRAHEGAEEWDEAAAVYRRFVRQTRNLDLKMEATTRLARVLLKSGNRRGARRTLEDAGRLARRNARRLKDGLYYAAEARYMQGELVLARYEAIKVAGAVEGLRERLQQKAELLREAALVFTDVVDFRVAEWVTAALYQIGRSYELFAEGLRAQPVPDGLSDDEEQSYRDQLAMFVIPMEDQALQAYEGGYQKALELRIFNRWTAKLFEALTRLNDVQYPPLREMGARIITDAPLSPPRPLEGLQRPTEGGDAKESAGPRRRRRPRSSDARSPAEDAS